jgi:hypothetical protein
VGGNILMVGHLLSRLFLRDGAFLHVHLIMSFLLFAVISRFESALCWNVFRGEVYCHVYEERPLETTVFAMGVGSVAYLCYHPGVRQRDASSPAHAHTTEGVEA